MMHKFEKLGKSASEISGVVLFYRLGWAASRTTRIERDMSRAD
jgi:hypothetical protein